MRLIAATLLGAWAGLAAAEEQPVVVELFTSQGCSSCPSADAMMQEIAAMDGVIALSLHVDYWDYIGWPDSFAQPGFTRRQKDYAHAARERMIYTPQVIVNGQDRVIGNDAMAVMERLAARKGAETPVTLELTRDGDSLVVEARAEAPVEPLLIHLVRYSPSESVDITGGENDGLSMNYSNVVTSWEVLGAWSGEEPLTMRLPAPGAEPAVVLLQEQGPGRIMAAERVPGR
jgi:hypothetical protein